LGEIRIANVWAETTVNSSVSQVIQVVALIPSLVIKSFIVSSSNRLIKVFCTVLQHRDSKLI